MYWSVVDGGIARANLDGTDIESVVFVNGVQSIAIGPVPEPATLGLLLLGGLALLRRRK